MVVIKPEIRTETIRLVEGEHISFRHFPTTAGLSQTQVSRITQDDDGFMWFGTQSGLNRYDGYKCRVFKHDASTAGSLSGVFTYSLFKDRSGRIWAGSDQYVDKYNPLTETFSRIRLNFSSPDKPVNFSFVYQDRTGVLWFPTANGLFCLNPTTGHIDHYLHDPNDPATFSRTEVLWAGADRSGNSWVGMDGALEQFNRDTGKVKVRIALKDTGYYVSLHEDRFGVSWLLDGNGRLFVFDRKNLRLTRYVFAPERDERGRVYAMLEDRDGTMWFGSGGYGLLKFDRTRNQLIRFSPRTGDSESLAGDRVLALYQDREGIIWVGFWEEAPDVFDPRSPSFEKFTYQRGNPDGLSSPLVSVIHQDSRDQLWLGGDRAMKILDRRTGKYTIFPGFKGHEVLSITEQGPNILWMGTAGLGLKRYDLNTGQLKSYRSVSTDSSTLCSNYVESTFLDRSGRLWTADSRALCYLNLATDRFTRFDRMSAVRTYHVIIQDHEGFMWAGSNFGLQRLDPSTGSVREFLHTDDPGSISDNRVMSILESHSGDLWVGTQNGLDRFDPSVGRFQHYNERNGLAGNVVSCILEDGRQRLWMGTNAGISSLDSAYKQFDNYSAADGLPGLDLTGWSACFESPSGEMFFGGFSGAVAFRPDKLTKSTFTPPIVLTRLRLFGNPVEINRNSPLKRSITHSDEIELSHPQNTFSLEFSALSYSSPSTNRYRYKLENLQQQWIPTDADQRLASFTTLPAGDYTFRVQGATIRGAWSEPGVALHVRILPAWWDTWYIRTLYVSICLFLIWSFYRYRTRQLGALYQLRVEERVRERTRIARELHDTLLQGFQGLMFRLQAVRDLLPDRALEARQFLDTALDRADNAIREAREAVQDLRSSAAVKDDLCERLRIVGQEFSGRSEADYPPEFELTEEGEAKVLDPILRDEIYRISREALANSFRHAHARKISATICYGNKTFVLRIRDDGVGIDRHVVLEPRNGHWGIIGMRERALSFGGRLEVWSEEKGGTEVTLTIPSSVAYRVPSSRPRRITTGRSNGNDVQ